MTVLVAAVAGIGALCVFDLFLTFAVLRRLREHSAELAALRRPGPDVGALVGRRLPESVLAREPRWVGIFDAHCSTCFEHAPAFAAEAAQTALAAVVAGTGPKADELAALLGGIPVLTGAAAADVVSALEVPAFPTFLRVAPDGTVELAHAGALAELPVPVGA
ncbi:hypothetical protein ILP97_52755 [Amycolatopsis sp. H6(2020)]|nr:hypothetical protein [Amycolatopsis sp. H6(2020)]